MPVRSFKSRVNVMHPALRACASIVSRKQPNTPDPRYIRQVKSFLYVSSSRAICTSRASIAGRPYWRLSCSMLSSLRKQKSKSRSGLSRLICSP